MNPNSRAIWPLSVLLSLCVILPSIGSAQNQVVQPNNNQTPAGSLEGNVLTLNLVADQGMWFPGGEGTHGILIQAFREENGPLQIPGPTIRVDEGTELVVTIRNAIPNAELHVHGFQSKPAVTEQVLKIPDGETRTARFVTGEPGPFFYAASTLVRNPGRRTGIDSQLSGVFMVDAAGASKEDKILVLGEYLRGIIPDVTGAQLAVNGRSWPTTEKYEVEVGKTNRWHIINTSFGNHPMHMHGLHYKVTSQTSLLSHTEYPADQQLEVVTRSVPRWGATSIEWAALHEGNWLFHCHISGHVSAGMISAIGDTPQEEVAQLPEGMGGMAIGIHASDPRGLSAPELAPVREITMMMEKSPEHYNEVPGFAVSFNESGKKIMPGSIPGPILVLNKGEPTSINLVNKLGEATSVHWHGMELESYYDGVAGYSGNGSSITPAIQHGESFEARMTPPRAGTYIYHTHAKDQRQLAAGLYGAMIISDPADPYDPATDKVFVMGLLGSTNIVGLRNEGPKLGINGVTNYEDQLKLGKQHRLRFINITANNGGFALWLSSTRGPEQWTSIAKDGADLPHSLQQSMEASAQVVSVGETYDFTWTPKVPGPYSLDVRRIGNGEIVGQAILFVEP